MARDKPLHQESSSSSSTPLSAPARTSVNNLQEKSVVSIPPDAFEEEINKTREVGRLPCRLSEDEETSILAKEQKLCEEGKKSAFSMELNFLHTQPQDVEDEEENEESGMQDLDSASLSEKAGSRDIELITLKIKWGKESHEICLKKEVYEALTLECLKKELFSRFSVNENRQKILGISKPSGQLSDSDRVCELNFRKPLSLVLVGNSSSCTEAASTAAIPSSVKSSKSKKSARFSSTVDHYYRIRKSIDKTFIYVMNEPRNAKKLLVLDLDDTLLEGGKSLDDIHKLKRPYLETFMRKVYQNYDLVIWSQTRWMWVEIKCYELGFLNSDLYAICFVLDRTSMCWVNKKDEKSGKKSHQAKPLDVIWSKFPDRWGPWNTLHVDDLSRNFVFNPRNGIQILPYRQECRDSDRELLYLSVYLESIADSSDVTQHNHYLWKEFGRRNCKE